MTVGSNPHMRLIGLCLAPFDESRGALLVEAAGPVRDWEAVLKLASARYVSPLVYCRLRDAGLLDRVPQAVRERFHKIYLNVAAHNALRVRQAVEEAQRLEASGIPLLFFKGSSLMLAGDYPDMGQRMFSDIDVFVRPGQKDFVDRYFMASPDWHYVKPLTHFEWDHSKFANAWGNMIEIHPALRPLRKNGADSLVERLLKRSEEREYRGGKVKILSREDRFIQTALHSTAYHNYDSTYLYTTVADMCHISSTVRGCLQWDRVFDYLEEEDLVEHIAVAMRAAQEVTGHSAFGPGLDYFYSRRPELRPLTEQLALALCRMLGKPWLFSSKLETYLFENLPLTTRIFRVMKRVASKLYYRVLEKLSPIENKGFEEVPVYPRFRFKFWDRDFLAYADSLRRFYKDIGYTRIYLPDQERKG